MRLASLFLLVVSYTAAAQPDAPTRAGDRALLFSIDGINLTAFEGGVGMKWWTGDSRALRVGLQLSARVEDQEPREGQRARHYGTGNALLLAGMEFHSRTPQRLSPFVSVEAGAGLGTQRVRDGQGLMPQDPVPTGGQTTVSVRGGVGLGVEYRVLEWLSLSGRHQLTGELYQRTDLNPYGTNRRMRGYAVGAGVPQLSLAVYF